MIITSRNEFMCGIYLFEFKSGKKCSDFIKRYSECPVWPIISKGLKRTQALVFAIELKRQKHGNFSQEENTLVMNPHFVGAERVGFVRNDQLIRLFPRHELEMGYSDSTPCDAQCENCPSFRNPCMGCPACYTY
jgi:hypothetical protein